MMDMPFLSAIEDPRRREMSAAVAKVLVDKRNRAVEMQEVLEQSGMLYEAVAEAFRDLDDVLLSLVRCVSGWIGGPLVSRAGHPASHDDVIESLTEFGRRYAHANATIRQAAIGRRTVPGAAERCGPRGETPRPRP